MDQLNKKNPITNLTPLEAIQHLKKKGYFQGTYSEEAHVNDPDVLTIIAMRNYIATKDYCEERYYMDYKTDLSTLTHAPAKPHAATTIRAIDNMCKELKKKINRPRYQYTGPKDDVQLSLFDYSLIQDKLSEKLNQVEKLSINCKNAFLVGELSSQEYLEWVNYFSHLDKYYSGESASKPLLSDYYLLTPEKLDSLLHYQTQF